MIPSSESIARLLKHAERYRRDGPARLALEPDLKMLRHLAFCCQEQIDLIDKTSDHLKALIAFSAHRRDWLRPPEAWEPPDEDATGQFRSLARHLFALYDVPRYLDAAWLTGLTPEGLRYQGWYKHVGRGSGEAKRLLTLEVRSKDRLIVQVRGLNNREPDNHERFILARWVESGGPSPSRSLLQEEQEE